MTENQNAPVANLRETRKQMAAAKRAHPAGKKAPAKKAPAKKATGTAGPKMRWTLDEERTAGNRAVPQTGVCGDATYKIARDGEKWKVTKRVGGKSTTLGSGLAYAASYRVAVDDCRKAAS
jgi:hypothetical protein